MNDQTIAVCDIYGPLLLRNGNPVLRRFLVRQHGQLTQILQTLEAQKESEQIIRRIAEVQENYSRMNLRIRFGGDKKCRNLRSHWRLRRGKPNWF